MAGIRNQQQGDRGKALQMYERAVETDPSLGKAKEKAAELKAMSIRPGSKSIPPPGGSLTPKAAAPSAVPPPAEPPEKKDTEEGSPR